MNQKVIAEEAHHNFPYVAVHPSYMHMLNSSLLGNEKLHSLAFECFNVALVICIKCPSAFMQ